MKKIMSFNCFRIVLLFTMTFVFSNIMVFSQPFEMDRSNVIWTSQSKNSSGSMPCGGHDIGLNVWVQNGEIYFYIAKSGAFDENNSLLKLGRVKVKFTPNPFKGSDFKQELELKNGNVIITGSDNGYSVRIRLWVDVFRPVIHMNISSNKPLQAEAFYESWRYKDHKERTGENFENSYRWGPYEHPVTFHDNISFRKSGILFYHRNKKKTVFDVTVKQQGLDSVKQQLFNPLSGLTFGGYMECTNMLPSGIDSGRYVNTDYEGWRLKSTKPSENYNLIVYLHTGQTKTAEEWKLSLDKTIKEANSKRKEAYLKTEKWWKNFWNRSFIFINPDTGSTSSPVWQTGRNYQLFRYMLACNAFGKYPTRFNGGLFTFDPVFVDSTRPFTPDYRNWGGGTFTAQNQRLVYYPMLKSGDFDLMKPEFDFYNRILPNAEIRSEIYWKHKGACFTEQLENFGLPNATEYGWNRPKGFEKGLQYNAWLEYTWDTALEFCYMILETQQYNNSDITRYIPLIESCLTFFDEHYQYLARKRGIKALSGKGHLILYPGSAGETYKMAYDANSTVAALQTVLKGLLGLPEKYLSGSRRKQFEKMLKRIPPISYRECEGHVTIAPARAWARINNVESMQLYPVFPWGIYGVGRPGLDTAINTWKYDPDAIKFRSYVGWKQDNIWAACLGLTKEAAGLNEKKLENGNLRFPAFWGPGFDWTPDHNWGGAGMTGLQNMILQKDGSKIFLFPAWPKNWNVHFKLHAPLNTTVEGILKNGKLKMLKVLPESRANDVSNMLNNAEK